MENRFQNYLDFGIKYIRFSGLIYNLIGWIKKYPEIIEINEVRKSLTYYFNDIKGHFTKEEVVNYFNNIGSDELNYLINIEEDEFWIDYDLEKSLFGDFEVSDNSVHWFLIPNETLCIDLEKFFGVYLGIGKEPEEVQDGNETW